MAGQPVPERTSHHSENTGWKGWNNRTNSNFKENEGEVSLCIMDGIKQIVCTISKGTGWEGENRCRLSTTCSSLVLASTCAHCLTPPIGGQLFMTSPRRLSYASVRSGPCPEVVNYA